MADSPSDPPGTESPTSATSLTVASAFAMLHPGVQRQLWRMQWTHLRSLQVQAIAACNNHQGSLILSAATASGKTEAAFLPVLSAIAREPAGSVRAVYVGPLKALINDQFGRVEQLCEYLEMPVYRWHGDVPASQKQKLIASPGGVLLITPESLESLFINRTGALARLFGGLRYVVIDELHSFLDNERGLHLRSLLHRLKGLMAGPHFRTIGLSATLGDFGIAQRFLNTAEPGSVQVINVPDAGKEVRYRVYGYRIAADFDPDQLPPRHPSDPVFRTATDLLEHTRESANLVFANRKADVEDYADLCGRLAADERRPERYLVHHGSLAADLRVEAEENMKSGVAATTFCSSTLEMGIDIGSVKSVGQIGPPWSVASLKQRLGRSGRRNDEPRIMRVYIHARDPGPDDEVFDRLHLDLIQAIAVTDLMLSGWVEPPALPVCDLSTLTQQIVSVIAETGGLAAATIYDRLCGNGAFADIEPKLFGMLLRQLGKVDVIEQMQGGDLILGLVGEKLRRHKGFYAVFPTPEAYTILHEGTVLGTLEATIDDGYRVDDHLLFAGRRWRITDVNTESLFIHVVPAKGRKRARFGGSPGEVHERVRRQMKQVLTSTASPRYLNPEAIGLLEDAKRSANHVGLGNLTLLPLSHNRTALFTWAGTQTQYTLAAMLAMADIDTVDYEIALVLNCGEDTARDVLYDLSQAPPSAHEVAAHCRPPRQRKYDYLLNDELRTIAKARGFVDMPGAMMLIRACDTRFR